MMNKMRNSKLRESRWSLAALLTVALLGLVGSASAKERKAKQSENEAHIVAHISFSGLSVVDMAMQRKVDDKYYLYVQHSKGEGISIIDVSKPSQAKTLGVISWPDPAVSSRLNVTGNLAIIAESEMRSMQGSSTSNDDLVLWDLSNPAVPRVVQKFTGVVKWLQDERNFIYVLNHDGLWVVSEPADRQPEQTAPATYGD
jgi:hypothetical protein